MNKILKGNIYTDLVWIVIGIIGAIYFYSKGSYWSCGIFLFLVFIYLIKIPKSIAKKKNSNSK